jgi:hypothetical protein
VNTAQCCVVVAKAVVDRQDTIKAAIKALAIAEGVSPLVAEAGAAALSAALADHLWAAAQVHADAGVAYVVDNR